MLCDALEGCAMNILLPLEKMTISEKMSAMESIWDDLIKTAGSLSSPEWHEAVLKQRSQSITDGTSGFSEWEGVKDRIRKSTR